MRKQLILEIGPVGVLLTQLLGFTTWNAFAEKVTQKDITDTTKHLVRNGIAEYGYSYVNLDSVRSFRRIPCVS